MSEALLFIDENWKNLAAMLWFFICFRGYSIYAAQAAAASNHSLATLMHHYRVRWMETMITRDIRIADTTVISNLERGVAFFASTTLLILAGLVTVLGSAEKAIDIVSDIPFAIPATTAEWEMKLLLLVALFIFAFFKFTWSLRQYGFASVMLGSAPMPADEVDNEGRVAYSTRMANVMSLAATNFNTGLRTYYYSIAVLGWFINSWVFMVLTAGVVLILYRREFKSRTLDELTMGRPE